MPLTPSVSTSPSVSSPSQLTASTRHNLSNFAKFFSRRLPAAARAGGNYATATSIIKTIQILP